MLDLSRLLPLPGPRRAAERRLLVHRSRECQALRRGARHRCHLRHRPIARMGRAREREAVLEAPSVPVGASGAGPKGMVAVSDSSWPWGAPCPVRDPARG